MFDLQLNMRQTMTRNSYTNSIRKFHTDTDLFLKADSKLRCTVALPRMVTVHFWRSHAKGAFVSVHSGTWHKRPKCGRKGARRQRLCSSRKWMASRDIDYKEKARNSMQDPQILKLVQFACDRSISSARFVLFVRREPSRTVQNDVNNDQQVNRQIFLQPK